VFSIYNPSPALPLKGKGDTFLLCGFVRKNFYHREHEEARREEK
jgi:hypothetical protein